jgi:succinate-acetate transporter protein
MYLATLNLTNCLVLILLLMLLLLLLLLLLLSFFNGKRVFIDEGGCDRLTTGVASSGSDSGDTASQFNSYFEKEKKPQNNNNNAKLW